MPVGNMKQTTTNVSAHLPQHLPDNVGLLCPRCSLDNRLCPANPNLLLHGRNRIIRSVDHPPNLEHYDLMSSTTNPYASCKFYTRTHAQTSCLRTSYHPSYNPLINRMHTFRTGAFDTESSNHSQHLPQACHTSGYGVHLTPPEGAHSYSYALYKTALCNAAHHSAA